jgi:hypothetical protein
MECGMSPGYRRTAPDPALRAAGLVLIVVAVLVLRHMVVLVHLRPPHDASMGEMALAAAGFLGLSAGMTLTALGAHIFDEVAISERWMRGPGHPFAQFRAQDEGPQIVANDDPAKVIDIGAVPPAAPRRVRR